MGLHQLRIPWFEISVLGDCPNLDVVVKFNIILFEMYLHPFCHKHLESGPCTVSSIHLIYIFSLWF